LQLAQHGFFLKATLGNAALRQRTAYARILKTGQRETNSMRQGMLVVCIMTAALMGCKQTKEVKQDRPIASEVKQQEVKQDKRVSKERAMTLTVKSTAFEAEHPIPKKHAYKGEGENISPPLSWSEAPAGTTSFALICDDPDAPSPKRPRENPWIHWVVYNIPADRMALAEGDTGGGLTGTTDFNETTWGGPMPPPGSGTHRYFFKVYALDVRLDLEAGATKADLLRAMEGHILAQGQVFGTYTRK
jgi:Raf kinase inhibitor-like YbhB/YbcL family protein